MKLLIPIERSYDITLVNEQPFASLLKGSTLTLLLQIFKKKEENNDPISR